MEAIQITVMVEVTPATASEDVVIELGPVVKKSPN